ncbi:MFS transporter [Roseomonas sp. BN140053]|uniref:MFS transporter n=1 Tax=Roseomonas sp. BN140053 TaxID=3391898 RepID=UPI0039E73449
MLAEPLARFLARRGIHYGWAVVAVTFLVMLSTASAVGMPGVLIRPLGEEFGWSISSISGPLALRLFLFGAMAPFAAAFMVRYGLRRVILCALGLILAGLGTAVLGMGELWQLWALWGLVLGFGTGLTAIVLGATVAGRWFSARRGLVVGLLTASSATGQLAFLPLAAWLAEHHGWRVALLPALGSCAVAAVLVLLFLRDRPADLGLRPFGEAPDAPIVAAPAATGSPVAAAFAALRDAAQLRIFWVLFGTFFICGLSTSGLVQTHFLPFCSDFGVAEVQAASLLAMMGAFDFIGTIGSGWLSDRYDARKLLFWYYGLRGLSLLYLPFSDFSFYGLAIFAVFYGLDWIATVPPTVRLAGAAFGRERAPMVFGWIFTGHQIGAAVAAFGAGWSRDELLTYLPAFLGAGAACLVAAVACLLVRRPGVPAPVRLPEGAAVPARA